MNQSSQIIVRACAGFASSRLRVTRCGLEEAMRMLEQGVASARDL